MSEEIDEETKIKIAQKYKEYLEKEKLNNIIEELGVSESTFHKYKNYESPKIKEIEKEKKETEEPKDFEEEYKPDETEDDEEINIDEVYIE